ncbi:DUF6470 family protein [Lysinibacillus sp. 54212]|uniref:DUF6470 family protein n=1 Tax=Lysinibacillus sp. 54212 TaxID=3119829 RepID=UPI002FCA3C53
MRLPQIQIRTTDIQMDLQIHNPKQHIEQPKATQTIQQPAAILDINTTRGQLKIDSSQARRDLGLIGPLESSRNYAEKGKQELLKGISRRAGEGRQLMESAGKGQGRAPIQSIAKQNHGPKRAGPYNIKFVPSIGSVKIDYTPGKTDVNFTPQKPKIDVQVNKPIHKYTPGDVTGTMIQRPHVEIDVVG